MWAAAKRSALIESLVAKPRRIESTRNTGFPGLSVAGSGSIRPILTTSMADEEVAVQSPIDLYVPDGGLDIPATKESGIMRPVKAWFPPTLADSAPHNPRLRICRLCLARLRPDVVSNILWVQYWDVVTRGDLG